MEAVSLTLFCPFLVFSKTFLCPSKKIFITFSFQYFETKKLLTVGLPAVCGPFKFNYYYITANHLFFSNPHIIFYIRKDSWLDEKSLVSVPITTTLQLGSFFFSTFNQIQDFVKLFLINLKTKLY